MAMILPDGTVMGCSCVAAMDATGDLGIGNILHTPLAELWRGARMRSLRSGFSQGTLNSTCAKCDMYRNLDFYRTRDGRRRAALNHARGQGSIVSAKAARVGPFSGG